MMNPYLNFKQSNDNFDEAGRRLNKAILDYRFGDVDESILRARHTDYNVALTTFKQSVNGLPYLTDDQLDNLIESVKG